MITRIIFILYAILIVVFWIWSFSWQSKKKLLWLVLYGDSIIMSLAILMYLPEDFLSEMIGKQVDVGYTIVILLLNLLIAIPKVYELWLLLKKRAFRLLLLDCLLLIITILYICIQRSILISHYDVSNS